MRHAVRGRAQALGFEPLRPRPKWRAKSWVVARRFYSRSASIRPSSVVVVRKEVLADRTQLGDLALSGKRQDGISLWDHLMAKPGSRRFPPTPIWSRWTPAASPASRRSPPPIASVCAHGDSPSDRRRPPRRRSPASGRAGAGARGCRRHEPTDASTIAEAWSSIQVGNSRCAIVRAWQRAGGGADAGAHPSSPSPRARACRHQPVSDAVKSPTINSLDRHALDFFALRT